MVLTKKELDILFKKFKSVSNPKFEDIKYYSKDKLKEILEDVQINYVHENYRYFSDEADDIIRENGILFELPYGTAIPANPLIATTFLPEKVQCLMYSNSPFKYCEYSTSKNVLAPPCLSNCLDALANKESKFPADSILVLNE